MDETSKTALDFLRREDKVGWVLDHLVSSFAEGIAQSAKEHGGESQVAFRQVESEISSKERIKREKYETSRPYDEAEKLALIRFALHEVFVTLPAIQAATAKSLKDLGAASSRIEFATPDDEERIDGSYVVEVSADKETIENIRQRFEKFTQELKS